MQCPNCGKEMEFGYLHGSAPMFWSSKANKWLIPDKRMGDVSVLNGSVPLAWICKDCRKVIVNY